jgi:hypothetical protein
LRSALFFTSPARTRQEDEVSRRIISAIRCILRAEDGSVRIVAPRKPGAG